MSLKFDVKIIFRTILCLIVGGVFIFSGLSKIPTLEQFGWTIVEASFLNWTLAEWIARIIIGLELLTGVLFILQFYIRKWVVPLSLLLLIFFSLYLIYVLILFGNDGNCGCFGDVVPMSPIESLLKNGALILAILIIRKLNPYYAFKWKKIATIVVILASLSVPFFMNPPESIYIQEKTVSQNKPIPLSILYNSAKNQAPSVELRKGKHVIAFLSLTCRFCRKAARKMAIMKKANPELSFYMVLNGDSANIAPFFDETRATNIPSSMFNGAEDFVKVNGSHSFPSIKWIQDTTVIRESNYINLDEKEILKWQNEH